MGKSNIKLTLDIVKDRLESINPNIEIISDEYVNANTHLKCICKIDGYKWEVKWSNLSQGKGCPKCNNKIKLTIDEVKSNISKINSSIEVISKEYTNAKTNLDFRCLIDGNVWKATYDNVHNKGNGCPKCKAMKHSERTKFKLEEVLDKIKIKNPNINILTKYYEGNSSPVECECAIDGYRWSTNWGKLLSGRGCQMCGGSAKLTMDFIRGKLSLLSPNIEIIDEIYNNARQPMKCRCITHNHIWKISWDNLSKGKGCPKCGILKCSGRNSPHWNGTSELSEYLRKYITEWKKSSFRKYNYRCDITSDNKDLIIHHLVSFGRILDITLDELNIESKGQIINYSDLELYIIKSKFIDNHYKYGLGVCLNRDIHIEFHKKYGYGNNTPEQYFEFKKNKISISNSV